MVSTIASQRTAPFDAARKQCTLTILVSAQPVLFVPVVRLLMSTDRPVDVRSSRAGQFRAAGRFAAVVAGLAAFVGVAGALAPEPAPVPQRWQLDVEPGAMHLISVDVPKVGPRMYFYMSYRVTNNSGQDVLFAPSFELADGEGNVTRSGRDVPQIVTTTVLDQVQNPLAEDQISIIGEMTQGKENGKDGVVIWAVNDTNPESITVYGAGFSGETASVELPGKDGKKQKFVLRKTLKLDFEAPGTLEGQKKQPIKLGTQSWIMR